MGITFFFCYLNFVLPSFCVTFVLCYLRFLLPLFLEAVLEAARQKTNAVPYLNRSPCRLLLMTITPLSGTMTSLSWLTKSGLKVNKAKTEICLFSRTNMPPLLTGVSIGRLTAFYVVLVPLELISSEPPLN